MHFLQCHVTIVLIKYMDMVGNIILICKCMLYIYTYYMTSFLFHVLVTEVHPAFLLFFPKKKVVTE